MKAHRIYESLIRYHPAKAPAEARKDFPASCWHCFMPESFSNQHCLEYHRGRNGLEIETIGDGQSKLSEAIQTYHVPGHGPDALALLVGEEAILVGDTVLPEITPFPNREAFFHQVRAILPSEYSSPDCVYGLRAYIRSLKKLESMGERFPHALVLPAHRLFYNRHWNEIDLRRGSPKSSTTTFSGVERSSRSCKTGPRPPGRSLSSIFPLPRWRASGY